MSSLSGGRWTWILWAQAAALAVIGVALWGWPVEAGQAWPWALPPLAARFTGSAFLGMAAAAATVAAWRAPSALRALAVMGVGTLLVPLAGILTPGVEVDPVAFTVLTLLLVTLAVVDVALFRAAFASERWGPLSRPFLVYFAIHLALVLPVGLALYLAPEAMADLAPWQLAPVNIRLLSGIVLASAPLSAMALRDRDWGAVHPTAASYAVFVTLATVAMVMHFGLFDAGRMRTWVFLGLYVLAALGAIAGVARAWRARDTARRSGMAGTATAGSADGG